MAWVETGNKYPGKLRMMRRRKKKERKKGNGKEGGKKRALWEREPDQPRRIAWVGCGGEKDRGRYSAESYSPAE